MNLPDVSKRPTGLEPTSGVIRADREHLRSGEVSPITRRSFCNGLLLSSAGVVLAAQSVAGEVATQQESLVAYPAMKIEGAEKLMPGSSLYFNYPTRTDPALIVRIDEREYVAYGRKCSHAGCSVEFDAARRCLKCPCHQGTFDSRMGYVMYGPPQRPLDQIVLQVRAGGEVWAVGRTIGRSTETFARRM